MRRARPNARCSGAPHACGPRPSTQNEREALKNTFIAKKQACRANIKLLPEGLGVLKEKELKDLQARTRRGNCARWENCARHALTGRERVVVASSCPRPLRHSGVPVTN